MNYYYIEYYRRAIKQHETGLKLMLGGTGLGKTSSLGALLHSGDFPEDTKFIYVANRIQLLDEMAGHVRGLNICIQQQQDLDHLREVVADGTLEALLNHPQIRLLIDSYNNRSRSFPIRLDTLVSRVNRFRRLLRFTEAELASLVDMLDHTAQLLNPLKRLLAFAGRVSQQPPMAGQAITQQQAAVLAALPVWRKLFPYIRFREDPSLRLLLVSVQKAFRGVFDGLRTQRLGRWDAPPSGRYVFIFDEFDFLENDLLKMLSEDKEVSDPFGLVQTFYHRINAQKLSHGGYLTQNSSWQGIREQLTEICCRISTLSSVHGIDFPRITHLITKDKALRGRAIFQSNYSLVTQPVFLNDPSSRVNSFELSTGSRGKSAFVLLDVVSRAVKDIVRLFKRLELEHEDIYPEILRQCFGGTDYLREIKQVNQIGWQHEWCETNYGHLLTNGFGLYEVRTDLSQLTDPDEVDIRYLSMNNSPEAMIREMCRVHLVFGLSATAHVRRTLRNFDWVGLAHPLESGDSFQPHPITVEDQADIDLANHDKELVRNNTICFEVAEPLPLTSSFGQQLANKAESNELVFGTGETKNQRLKRARHFFGLLSWIVQQPADRRALRQTHLVFLSSVKQLSYLLGTIRADEDGWFKATGLSSPDSSALLEFYDLTYRDEVSGKKLDCHVVLYDAQFSKNLRRDPLLEEQYNALFWDGKPVVVVTTYPSAGNGVNLQYFLTRKDYQTNNSDGKRDFIHLHLLDSPYFYFSGTSSEGPKEDHQAAIKRDVYSMMKLLHAKQISEAQAVGQLNHIRSINYFNSTYLALPDGILNQFTVFVQALGRIERVWQPMDDQIIRLDKDVYKVFEQLLVDKSLTTERENYLRFASSNMQRLLTAVEKYAHIHRDEVEDELLDINRVNDFARRAIHQMVLDIQQFRQTGRPADIRERWNKLREDVLRHNMQADSLKQIRGVFATDYSREGNLYMNRKWQIAPPSANSHEFERWNLNAVYRPLSVIKNTALTNFFRVRGYELAFLDSGNFFLPYVHQAILSGAIGEEATRAIFGMKGITVSGDSIPDRLFEVADLRIEERPIFIDCKNYGAQTLRQFALPPDDPLYRPTLNEPHFKERMVDKWQTIKRFLGSTLGEPCRLVVMNLVQDEEGAIRYYDADFEQVDTWEQARIIILTGALKRQPVDSKDLLTAACTTLLTHLHL